MRLLPKVRFTLGTVMMIVLFAASASALFARICHLLEENPPANMPGWKYDSAAVVILAIGLTAVALGSLKSHSAAQTMLQGTLACLGYLSLIQLAEGDHPRLLLYFFQALFAVLAALPLLARRFVKARMDRGPRRDWWKRTCEAVFFAFLNMILVLAGIFLQVFVVEICPQLLR